MGGGLKIKSLVLALAFALFWPFFLSAQEKELIDSFDSLNGWKAIEAEQVSIKLSEAETGGRKCLRLDYDFIAGSGYGGMQKKFPIELPDNYEFSFYLKADSPVNTLEFKLLDEDGSSVWWYNNRNYSFPKEWTKVTVKQRQISKAWGPNPLQKPKKIDKIEIIVTSVNGGKGTLYFDDFRIEQRPPVTANFPNPMAEASSSLSEKFAARKLFDEKNAEWRSKNSPVKESLIIDMKENREFGGLVITQDETNYASNLIIYLSEDKTNWSEAYRVSKGKGGKSFFDLRESEARYIKLEFEKCNGQYFSVKEIEIKSLGFTETRNSFFESIAREKPKGCYPKYFNPQQSNFTVAGVNGDVKEALINEEGMVETDKQSFSIEPFLFSGNKFITWNDVKTTQKLEKNYLPIPSVIRENDNFILETKIFCDGQAGNSYLNTEYTIINKQNNKSKGSFYLAVRPFQVNPPVQFLNTPGGSSRIDSIKYSGNSVYVNNRVILPLTKPDGFGASEFDSGDITDFICKNSLPKDTCVNDHYSAASGALKYSFELKPGEKAIYRFVIPFYPQSESALDKLEAQSSNEDFMKRLDANIKYWEGKLDFARFNLPESADKLVNTLKTSLAYILINKDNSGFQPGSRSYERSWIRDGAMTSSSLLKMGIINEVKEYIEWYSKYQYPNGKIPCVVDTRGPDPVPENDSPGEYIFLINQYFQFTKDTAFLKSKYESVKKTVGYIEYLISQTRNERYLTNDSLVLFYGLLPESISHEGYSEKPMHSYWDDFWCVKGLKDAVEIARILNDKENIDRFLILHANFTNDFYSSVRLSIDRHKIDYIPGCAELGDFDATSTAIGLLPCNEKNNIPKRYLPKTFNRYYEFFKKRRDDKSYDWVNYTPYEIRTVGAFNYMDLPEISHEMLDFFFKDQRPAGWNHWAEVVWRDSLTPHFIGDMPHTWVASDFVNSVRSFFVYEDEIEKSLVLGSGLYKEWIDAPNGISVSSLNTYYGPINYSVKKKDSSYVFEINGKINMPDLKMIIKNFNLKRLPEKVIINGHESHLFDTNSITIKEFPAKVEIVY
jgi:hypothetical protein